MSEDTELRINDRHGALATRETRQVQLQGGSARQLAEQVVMDHFGELEAQQRARYEAVQRTIAVRREERARNLAWEREQAAARDREARAQRQAVLDRAYEENQRRVAQNRAKYGF